MFPRPWQALDDPDYGTSSSQFGRGRRSHVDARESRGGSGASLSGPVPVGSGSGLGRGGADRPVRAGAPAPAAGRASPSRRCRACRGLGRRYAGRPPRCWGCRCVARGREVESGRSQGGVAILGPATPQNARGVVRGDSRGRRATSSPNYRGVPGPRWRTSPSTNPRNEHGQADRREPRLRGAARKPSPVAADTPAAVVESRLTEGGERSGSARYAELRRCSTPTPSPAA